MAIKKRLLAKPVPKVYEKESELKRDIISFLKDNQVFSWKNHTTGIRSASGWRKLNTPGDMVGIPDILGMYQGKFLCIEVKLPGGKVSVEQRLFLQRVKDLGGIAVIARSVEDVQEALFH